MLTAVVLGLIKSLIVLMLFVMPLASFLTWGERKWSALMQDRVGPNRASIPRGLIGNKSEVALNGLLHVVADGLKMMFKEDFEPVKGNKYLHFVAPLISLFPALAAVVVIPFTGEIDLGRYLLFGEHEVDLRNFRLQIADLNVGLLYIFTISSIAPYGPAIAGWASDNKFSLMGSLRTSSQMISYEVTMGLTLIGLMILYGSVRLGDIVEQQAGTLFGVLPAWGIFVQPVGAICFLVCAMAENKRAPFDLPEGESEIVAGYFTEYSSMKFGMFFLGEFAEVVVISSFFSSLFLGGYHFPYMTPESYVSLATPLILAGCVAFLAVFLFSVLFNSLAPLVRGKDALKNQVLFVFGPVATVFFVAALANGNLGALLSGDVSGFVFGAPEKAPAEILPPLFMGLTQALTLGVKVIIMCWLSLVIRWTVPRFRYDQVMALGWKMILPVSLANVIVTAIFVALVG